MGSHQYLNNLLEIKRMIGVLYRDEAYDHRGCYRQCVVTICGLHKAKAKCILYLCSPCLDHHTSLETTINLIETKDTVLLKTT